MQYHIYLINYTISSLSKWLVLVGGQVMAKEDSNGLQLLFLFVNFHALLFYLLLNCYHLVCLPNS